MAHTNDEDFVSSPFDVELLVSDMPGFTTDEFTFLLRKLGNDRIRRVVTGLQWEELTEEVRSRAVDSFRLSRAGAQSLMDKLYSLGLRPKESAYFNPALRATQEHLEDMRAIAFTKIEVDQPRKK
jgi:hypothetical protein